MTDNNGIEKDLKKLRATERTKIEGNLEKQFRLQPGLVTAARSLIDFAVGERAERLSDLEHKLRDEGREATASVVRLVRTETHPEIAAQLKWRYRR